MIKQPVDTEIYTEYITVDSRDDIKLSKQPDCILKMKVNLLFIFLGKDLKILKKLH